MHYPDAAYELAREIQQTGNPALWGILADLLDEHGLEWLAAHARMHYAKTDGFINCPVIDNILRDGKRLRGMVVPGPYPGEDE